MHPVASEHRRLRAVLATAVAVTAGLVCGVAPAHAAERTATPATFPGVFAAAQADDTILLASGDYGTFTGAMKPGRVTIKAQDGATPTMRVNFNPASSITLDGLRLTEIHIGDSRTKNITVRNSSIPGSTKLQSSQLVNANMNRPGFDGGGGY